MHARDLAGRQKNFDGPEIVREFAGLPRGRQNHPHQPDAPLAAQIMQQADPPFRRPDDRPGFQRRESRLRRTGTRIFGRGGLRILRIALLQRGDPQPFFLATCQLRLIQLAGGIRFRKLFKMLFIVHAPRTRVKALVICLNRLSELLYPSV